MIEQQISAQPDEHGVTRVKLPDGELRIFEPAAGSDDASRMYVLDVLGIDALVRWVNDSQNEGEYDVDAFYGPQLRAHLTAKHGVPEAQRQDLSDPNCAGLHRELHDEHLDEKHDHPCYHLDVRIDGDCSSIAPHSGPLMVGGAMNVDEWFDIEGDEQADELKDNPDDTPKARLEYLRQELRAERMSYSELAELRSLVGHIELGDVELLYAAGVPEFPDDELDPDTSGETR